VLINLHRDRILDSIDDKTSPEQQSIVAAVLVMYDHGLLKVTFNTNGAALYSLRDSITSKQWEAARSEWVQMDPNFHTRALWNDAQ
jgi:hypothetical protein